MRKKKKNEIYAFGQHISMSAHKARRIIDQIRGRSYEETLMILELMPYRACYSIFKLVYSAAANASYNMGSNETNLIISKAEVNEGRTVKKFQPRAQGRSYQIKRPTCHITIGVKDISLVDNDINDIINIINMDPIKSWRYSWKNALRPAYTDLIDANMYSNEEVWDKK